MNISQKQDILNAIESLLNDDIDARFISSNIPVSDLKLLYFGEYPYAEFKTLLERMLLQLKNELQEGFGLFLPIQETFNNEYQVVNLVNDISNLNSLLLANKLKRPNIQSSLNQASVVLQKLIYYQIANGFWDKSSVKKHDVDSEKIKTLMNNAILYTSQIENSVNKFDELQALLTQKITELDGYNNKISKRSDDINHILNNAKNIEISITEIRSNCLVKAEEINSTAKVIDNKLSQINSVASNYKNEFDAMRHDVKILLAESNQLNEVIKQQNEIAQKDATTINSKKSEIVKLIGMAADGSLGYKFNERKDQLNTSVKWWITGVVITSIFAIAWAVVVFICLAAKGGNQYIDLLINLIKTSPGFLLMGFVLKQYTKERNLQEEYAFKSAVAMTLTSYSNMLEEKDLESNKSRQEMLLKSIDQVYAKPKSLIEKSEKPFSLNTKDLTESVKALTDVVKEIKK